MKRETIIVAVVVIILIALVYWHTSKSASDEAAAGKPAPAEAKSILDKFLPSRASESSDKEKPGDAKAQKNLTGVPPGGAAGSPGFSPAALPPSGLMQRSQTIRSEGRGSQVGGGVSGSDKPDVNIPSQSGDEQANKDQDGEEPSAGPDEPSSDDIRPPEEESPAKKPQRPHLR